MTLVLCSRKPGEPGLLISATPLTTSEKGLPRPSCGLPRAGFPGFEGETSPRPFPGKQQGP